MGKLILPASHMTSKLAGHFTLTRRGPDGRVRQILEFDNLITDTGLDLIYNSPTMAYGIGYYLNRCCVGTGNTPPAITDTALAAYLANVGAYAGGDAATSRSYVAGPPTYWRAVQTYRFNTGAAAGNLTEIGIYPSNGGVGALFSRALIVDGAGNPTTLTVLSDEILDVTYELRVYLNTDDVLGTFDIEGITYNTVTRLADIDTTPSIGNRLARTSDGTTFSVTAYHGSLGSITEFPSGSYYAVSYNNGATESTYSAGDRYIDSTTTIPVGSANWPEGITAFLFVGNLHKYQMSFIDPLTGKGIPKVTGQKMTVTFRYSWDRV